MKNLPTLYEDYQELMLDLNIFGKIIEVPQQSLDEMKESLFEEFKRRKPLPTLENERYKLSKLVSSDFLIAYNKEVELLENESIVDFVKSESVERVNTSIEGSISDEIRSLFSYENQVTELDREEIKKKYMSDEEEFQGGVASTEKLFNSTPEQENLVLNDEEIEGLGKSIEMDGIQVDMDLINSIETESSEIKVDVDIAVDEDISDNEDSEPKALNIVVEEDISDVSDDSYSEDDEDDSYEDESEDDDDDSYEDESEDDDDDSYEDESEDNEDDSYEDESEDDDDDEDDSYEDESEDDDDDEDDSYEDESEDDEDDSYEDESEDDDDDSYEDESEDDEDDSYEDEDDSYEDEDDSYEDESEDEEDEDESYDDDEDYEDGSYEDESEDTSYEEHSVNIKEPVSSENKINSSVEEVKDVSNINVGNVKVQESNFIDSILDDNTDLGFVDKLIASNTEINVPPPPIQKAVDIQQTKVETVNKEEEPTDLRQFIRKHPRCEISFALKYFTKKQINDAIKMGKVVKKGNILKI